MPGICPALARSRNAMRHNLNLRYTPRGRPVSRQRLRWRLGDESRGNCVSFITALKRSGYFSKIEIKESKQDDKNTAVQTFIFELSAEITPPPAGVPAPHAQAKPASAPAQPAPSATRPKVG